MKTLYFDCSMGAAGDMLAAALFELIEGKEKFLARVRALNIPGVSISVEESVKCGITGTHFSVKMGGKEEDEPHGQHHHHHRSMAEIEEIIHNSGLDEETQTDVLNVYRLIAESESRVHGTPVTEIHFHEVGMADAIADISAVCLLMREIGVEKVLSSPVNVGGGTVKTAHGVLPVPVPATAELLRGVPVYDGGIKSELCTPTGAALLKYFVSDFVPMPPMRTEKIGYGMGRKDFEQANCVRAMLGETEDSAETVVELCCNIDDMSGEELGFAMERAFECGALDCWFEPIGMKKSRPGTLFSVLCREGEKEKLAACIFRHTTTLGIRESVCRRYTLRREIKTAETPLGNVRIKTAEGFGVSRSKPEYEDLVKIAAESDMSIAQVRERLSGYLE